MPSSMHLMKVLLLDSNGNMMHLYLNDRIKRKEEKIHSAFLQSMNLILPSLLVR